MNRFRKLAATGAAAGLASVLIAAGGQPGKPAAGKPAADAGKPQAQENPMKTTDAEALATFKAEEGVWDMDVTLWFRPGVEPVKSKATMTSRAILGGMFLEQRIEGGTLGPAMGNAPWSSMSVTGYNPTTRQYEVVRMGSSTSVMMVLRGGNGPDAKKLEVSGEYQLMGMKCSQRDVSDSTDPDVRHIVSYMKFGDAPEYKGAEMKATRRK